MQIVWEPLEFNEDELMEAIKSDTLHKSDMPSVLFQGAFGVESLLDPMAISKRHRLIVGHCDFNLSGRRANLVQRVPGVDLLKVISRYAFVFSPGKAFPEEEVKSSIEKALGCGQPKKSNNVKELIDKLEGAYCIYIRDGKTTYFTEDDDNFLDMVEMMRESKEKYGGDLYEGTA